MRIERPGLVVAVAILLSLPMAPGVLDGAISPTAALIRFLLALVLCWGGGTLIVNVLGRYNDQSRRSDLARMVEMARQRAAEQRQQQTDASAPPGTPPSVA